MSTNGLLYDPLHVQLSINGAQMSLPELSKEPISGLKWSPQLSEYERARYAAALAAAVIESSSDAIITKNLDGIITGWNAAAEQMFGYSAEEVMGRSVTVLFPEDHINEEPEIIR